MWGRVKDGDMLTNTRIRQKGEERITFNKRIVENTD